jgi:YHS domain-containing protein
LRMKKFALCMSLIAVMASPLVLAAIPGFDDPINKKCPLTGKDIVAGRTSEYEKQLIGFCCMDCVGKFESDPKKFIGKVKEFKKSKSQAEEISFADPINKTCPITGKDVNATKTVDYEGQTIGLCCDDCKGKFEADPKKYIGKVKEFKKKKSAAEEVAFFDDPINKKCPITGKDIVAGRTSEYEKQLIGFCCMDCVGKFESDPKKFIGKVKEFKKSKSQAEEISFGDAINKKCPVAGKDVDPKVTFTYQDQVIAFCCKDCCAKFAKEPEKFIEKVPEFKKKKSSVAQEIFFGDPINKTCPITGKDVNATKTVDYEGQTIGLCCDDCKGKFETDPKKYIGKVKEFKKKKSSVEE